MTSPVPDLPDRCPTCGYPLAGLTLENQSGECPECGHRFSRGNELQALRTAVQGAVGSRRCPVCGRDLTGAPPGACPGCGSRYRVPR